MTTRPLPSIPAGTADFGAIRRRNQVYVDKTAYIEKMLATPLDYAFLARPRRFGKSLLASTLHHLFARTDDSLFRGLSIEATGFLARVPRRPVLPLDMSKMAANPRIIENQLHWRVDMAAQFLGLERPRPDLPPGNALEDAIQQLRVRANGQSVAVLIDEYDAPLTKLLGRPDIEDEAKEVALSALRDFYGVLKDHPAIGFVFMTGISRVEGAHLFSSLNNMTDISQDMEYGSVCGFTEREIDQVLPMHIEQAAQNCGVAPENIRADMRAHYNGYRFMPDSEPVYNPVSYLHALQELQNPANLTVLQARGYPRPWISTGIPYFLFRYMQVQGFDARDIRADAVSSVWRRFNLRHPGLMPLLFQTGFLTFLRDEAGKVKLGYPNREVESAFTEGLFLSFLGKTFDDTEDVRYQLHDIETALTQGDLNGACAAFNDLLDGVPFALLRTERHYQGLFHMACLMCRSLLRVESEAPTRRGVADTIVETQTAIYVFELKRDASAQAAKQQILTRAYGNKYKGRGKSVYGIGLNFEDAKAKKAGDEWDSTGQYWQMEDFSILPRSNTKSVRFSNNVDDAISDQNI